MACGSCGKARQVISPGAAQALANVPAAKYTVTTPDGKSETFERYIDAAVFRRQTNGNLTTTTA